MRIRALLPDQGGRDSKSRTHHPPNCSGTALQGPQTRRDGGSVAGFRGTSLTLFRQPQEQHIAVRASGPAGGRSHFELVVLAPVEAPKLCALPASQQGLCPGSSLASWHRLGPEQRCVGLGRGSGAAYLGESGERRMLMTRPFPSPGLAHHWVLGLTFQLSHTAGPDLGPFAGSGFSRVTFSS